MRKGLTEIVFILDESGSMHGLEDSTMGGYNTLLARNKEMEGEAEGFRARRRRLEELRAKLAK